MSDQTSILKLASKELSAQQVAQIRALLWSAFARDEHGGFTEDDWQHALGGTHFIALVDGEIVSHASVVGRQLQVASRPVRTGYVEAVATLPRRQGRGYGTAVMRDVAKLIKDAYELGALATGSQGFYERLGWHVWRGPSSVRTDSGEQPTPDEDGYIMALMTPATPPYIDPDVPISCEWRPGDVW